MRLRSTNRGPRPSWRPALVALIAIAAGLPAGGCALVASWPAIGDDTAINDPNVSPMPKVIAAGVRECMYRYPVIGPYVINLPEGLERFRAERIAQEIGPEASIVTASDQNLPIYHVTRVWVRGDRAQVDVVRPLDEPKSWQRVTVYLHHTFDGWESEFVKLWPLGMATPGSLYGWLDTGAVGDPPPMESSTTLTPSEPERAPAENTSSNANPDDGIRQTIQVKEGTDDGSGN